MIWSPRMTKVLAAAGAAAALLALPVAASAQSGQDATGRGFGQHVSQCAHLMGGFSGDHNPGMHHGYAGWDGQTCTP